MTRHWQRRWAALLAALAVLSITLAACGKDEKTEPASSGDAAGADAVQLVDHTASTRYKIGDPAPNFTLTTADGQSVALADYVGKQPVMLFFHMAAG